MSTEAIEAERAACKAKPDGGILACAAHIMEWKLRRKWIGGLTAGGALTLALTIEHWRKLWR